MKNKWASYTRRTHLLIFNTGLLDLDEDLGNYVIVHELLHFRVPNHGKLWKSLRRVHLGDYERQEERLKKITPRMKEEWQPLMATTSSHHASRAR
jgi:predicted metal-dependent hydrolase